MGFRASALWPAGELIVGEGYHLAEGLEMDADDIFGLWWVASAEEGYEGDFVPARK